MGRPKLNTIEEKMEETSEPKEIMFICHKYPALHVGIHAHDPKKGISGKGVSFTPCRFGGILKTKDAEAIHAIRETNEYKHKVIEEVPTDKYLEIISVPGLFNGPSITLGAKTSGDVDVAKEMAVTDSEKVEYFRNKFMK